MAALAPRSPRHDAGAIEVDCTVSAEFSNRAYSTSSTVSSVQGTIDVLHPIVDHGGDAEFEVAPDTGWSLESFTGNPCTPSDNSDGTWTAEDITEDCALEAVIVEDTTTLLTASMNPV